MEMPAARFLEVGPIRTRYFEAGQGPAVVLIHGGDFDYRTLVSAEGWGPLFGPLAEKFHVYAFDKLGAGMTDNPASDEQYTMGATIDHAWGVLQGLDIPKAVLVGSSRGAMPAVRIALDHPDRVSAVVILASNTLAPDDLSVPLYFYTQMYETPNAVPTPETVRQLYEANSYRKGRSGPDPTQGINELRPFHPDRPFEAGAIERMHRLMNEFFLPDLEVVKAKTLRQLRYYGLRMPSLIVWGLEDPSAPLKIGVELYRIIGPASKWAEFHVLNRAGHGAYRDRPDDVAGVITEFLQRALAKTGSYA
jgi:pimeloyl-ACP methyl ester carboxylesterase